MDEPNACNLVAPPPLVFRWNTACLKARYSDPIFIPCFFAPVGNICRNHRIQYHCYADDLQIYLFVNSSDDMESKICMIEECIKDLELWIACNGLKHALLKIRPYKHNFHGEHLRPSISAVQSPPSWRGLDRYSVVGEASGSVDATFT